MNPTQQLHLLESTFRTLGWLDEGQSVFEARVPGHLQSHYPDLFPNAKSVAPSEDLAHILPPPLQRSALEPDDDLLSPSPSEMERGPGGEVIGTLPGTGHLAPGTPHPTCPPIPTTSGNMLEPEPPHIPESETPEMEEKKRSRKMCRGLTRTGALCRAYKMYAGDLCIFHNAKAVNEQQWHEAAEQFDPEKVAEAKATAIDLDLVPVQLKDNAGVVAFSEGMIRLQLAGTVPHHTSRMVASYLRIAQRALPSSAEARPAPEPEQHKRHVESFVHAAPAVKERLEKQDIHQRDLTNEDVGIRRENYLKANLKYPAPPKPAPSKLDRLRALSRY